MNVHFLRQIDRIKRQLLALGAMVEEALQDSVSAIQNRDVDLANKIIDGDQKIDLAEIDVEEECLHTLALYQPVAADLRLLVSVLKINHDLERIGDLAANIAEQTCFLAGEAIVERIPFDLDGMCGIVISMLRKSLDALVNMDVEQAEVVRKLDDDVDSIHRNMYDQIISAMRDNPAQLEQMMHLQNVSRQLERIADHAVNIAKDVQYTAEGQIVRHRRAQRDRAAQEARQAD